MALTFVETPYFTRQLSEYVVDADYRIFQQELLENPERGDVIVGCHGLRKARMAIGERGKSGGARVIYLHLPTENPIYLFLLFRKSDTANLTKSQRNELGELANQIKTSHAKKRKTS